MYRAELPLNSASYCASARCSSRVGQRQRPPASAPAAKNDVVEFHFTPVSGQRNASQKLVFRSKNSTITVIAMTYEAMIVPPRRSRDRLCALQNSESVMGRCRDCEITTQRPQEVVPRVQERDQPDGDQRRRDLRNEMYRNVWNMLQPSRREASSSSTGTASINCRSTNSAKAGPIQGKMTAHSLFSRSTSSRIK